MAINPHLEGIICNCGKPAEYMDFAVYKKGRCARCEVDDRQKYLEERNAQLSELVLLITPVHNGVFTWSEGAKQAVNDVNDMKAKICIQNVTIASQAECIDILSKRINMLESERGPGISAPQQIQTCSVGADWE